MQMTKAQIESMVRYEDEYVMVVHKPPFLAVETKNPRQQDLVSLLKNYRSLCGEAAFIGLIHRLDQPVEGLLVLAKTTRAAERLSAGLAGGDFTKEYLAVACGVTPEKGTLVHTLKRDGRTNFSRVVRVGTPGGKEARLSYERLAVIDEKGLPAVYEPGDCCTSEGHVAGAGKYDSAGRLGGCKKSLLIIRLETGRHHQIRVQFAAEGHPLWGDEKYGARAAEIGGGVFNDTKGVKKIPPALCSSRLAFVHPASGAQMEFCTKPSGAGFSLFSTEVDAWFLRQKAENKIVI